MSPADEPIGGGFLLAEWPALPGVRALSTLRRGAGIGGSAPPFDQLNLGSRCGDDADTVSCNRRLLQSTLQLDRAPRWLRQVHGDRVIRFNVQPGEQGGPSAEEPEADAAVTSETGVALVVLTADCLPVVFSALDGSEIGAAHAGWRGLAAGVLERTLEAMHTPPDRLQAWIGPAAGPASYEVGAEVRAAFVSAPGACASVPEAFVATRPGHWLCNLPALATERLRAAGLSQISGGTLCTIGDRKRFFSHRRDGVTGRMATLIWKTAAEPPPSA